MKEKLYPSSMPHPIPKLPRLSSLTDCQIHDFYLIKHISLVPKLQIKRPIIIYSIVSKNGFYSVIDKMNTLIYS